MAALAAASLAAGLAARKAAWLCQRLPHSLLGWCFAVVSKLYIAYLKNRLLSWTGYMTMCSVGQARQATATACAVHESCLLELHSNGIAFHEECAADNA